MPQALQKLVAVDWVELQDVNGVWIADAGGYCVPSNRLPADAKVMKESGGQLIFCFRLYTVAIESFVKFQTAGHIEVAESRHI